MTNLKAMPHNIETEQSVIGSVFMDNEVLPHISYLNVDDFYDEKHWIIWKAIIHLYENKTPVDFLTISDYLEKKKKLDCIWWVGYLTETTSSVPTSSRAVYYAEIVSECLWRRKLIRLWHYIQEMWYKEEIPLKESFELIKKKFLNLRFTSVKLRLKDWKELRQLVRKSFEWKKELESKWKELVINSDLWLSFEKWSHTVIWALPSHWKSALLLNLLIEFAQKWYIVLYVNIEMTEKQVMDRIYAYLTWIDSTKFKYMNCDDYEDILKNAENEFDKFKDNFKMLTSWNISSTDISTVITEMAIDGWIDIHWVDYLWILRDKANSKVEQMATISNNLREITKDLETVWIVAAQFSKEWYRANKPSFAHIKDSSTIFDDADMALVLIRKKDNKSFALSQTHELIIEKNRIWNIWSIKLSFDKEYLRFKKCG